MKWDLIIGGSRELLGKFSAFAGQLRPIDFESLDDLVGELRTLSLESAIDKVAHDHHEERQHNAFIEGFPLGVFKLGRPCDLGPRFGF